MSRAPRLRCVAIACRRYSLKACGDSFCHTHWLILPRTLRQSLAVRSHDFDPEWWIAFRQATQHLIRCRDARRIATGVAWPPVPDAKEVRP